MKPIDFKGSNVRLLPPSDYPDMKSEIGVAIEPMVIYREGSFMGSCWKMSLGDIIRMVLSRKIWLWVYGNWHPPVRMTSRDPFRSSR